jgi:hypothetical protein
MLDAKSNVDSLTECAEGLVNSPAGCGDGICVTPLESCSTCPADCGSCPPTTCGNAVCNAPADCLACPSECTPAQCAAVCGDGACTGSEDCGSCPQDCGQITRNYTYDSLDRLIEASGYPTADLVWDYDADGTMTQGPLGTSTIVGHEITQRPSAGTGRSGHRTARY